MNFPEGRGKGASEDKRIGVPSGEINGKGQRGGKNFWGKIKGTQRTGRVAKREKMLRG